jgi:ABC1 atypical kinase-like domain
VWHDGRQVAVKVQYPGAGRALISDLGQLSRFARLFGALMPGLDAKPLLAELRGRVAEELDYRLEAAAQQAFAACYADDPDVCVPGVVLDGVGVGVDLTALRAFLVPLAEPSRAESFGFSREWLRTETMQASALRSSSVLRRLNLPPSYVLIHRVLASGLGVLCHHARQIGQHPAPVMAQHPARPQRPRQPSGQACLIRQAPHQAQPGMRHDPGPAARDFQAVRPRGNVHFQSAPRLGTSKDVDTLTVPAQEHFSRQARRAIPIPA